MWRLVFLIVLAAVLAGCGPKLTPIYAVREMEQSAALNRAESARIGESLLSGLDMFAYAAYSPREPGEISAPDGVALQPLAVDQQWIAYYRLDDGSLLVEAPRSVTPEDVRLGLRIDEDGRVEGNRPWFDLKAKSRLAQPSWKGERRFLFIRSGSHAVDTFIFDLKYLGMQDGAGVFEYIDHKVAGAKAPIAEQRVIEPQTNIQMHGLDIRIVAVYPDHVRYVVEPVR